MVITIKHMRTFGCFIYSGLVKQDRKRSLDATGDTFTEGNHFRPSSCSMKKEQVVSCQFSVWYPIFKKHTIKRYTPATRQTRTRCRAMEMTLPWR